MLPFAELADALLAVPRIAIHGPWARSLEYALLQGPPPGRAPGSHPEPLWSGGAMLHGARYTPVGSFPTLYLASDQVTAMVEVGSIFSHPLLAIKTIATNPVVTFAVDGMLADVVDLTNRETQATLHTNVAELTGSWILASPSVTQELGRAAFDSGVITALRYPSSKRPDAWCLAVFTDRLLLNATNYLEVVDTNAVLAQRLP